MASSETWRGGCALPTGDVGGSGGAEQVATCPEGSFDLDRGTNGVIRGDALNTFFHFPRLALHFALNGWDGPTVA